MKAALLVGLFGIGSSFGVGRGILNLENWDVLRVLIASNCSGFLSLILILKAERTPWIRRRILNRSLKTWIVFVSLFLLGLVVGAPAMREVRGFSFLIFPAICSTGFLIMAFGPVQDRIVARIQRRSRAH